MFKKYFNSKFFIRLNKQESKEFIFSCAKKIGIYGSIAIAVTDTFTYCAEVSGSSMQPVINPSNESQDTLLLFRMPITFNNLKRGDVVSLTSPKYSQERLLKRIVGLPGDIVKTKYPFKREYVVVPPGHCWIEGDNQAKSYDSNSYGAVPIGLLIAKAGFIIWPLSRIQKISNEMPSNRVLYPLDLTFNENKIPDHLDDEDDDGIEKLVIENNRKFSENFEPIIFSVSITQHSESKRNYYVDYIKAT